MSEVILYNSDCIQAMTEIADHSINLILTDPPYNLGNFMISRDTNLKKMRDNFFGAAGWDNLEYDEWANAMDGFFAQAARVMKKGGSMIVFMAAIKVETTISLAEKHGFYYKTTGIWHKLNPMPRNMNLHFVNSTETWIYFTYKTRTGTFNNNGAVLHDFIETAVTPASERKYGKHPTQKPEVLMSHFVEVLSNIDDWVLDPFMGSGTSGVVAKRASRNFIGIELDENYFDMAKKRIEGGRTECNLQSLTSLRVLVVCHLALSKPVFMLYWQMSMTTRLQLHTDKTTMKLKWWSVISLR